MTREEAIICLKGIKNYGRDTFNEQSDWQESLDMAIEAISKTLEKEPRKGHWILTDIEGYRVWNCNCSECGKDPQDYIGGSEDWWLIRNKLPKFCPNCGADMRGEL